MSRRTRSASTRSALVALTLALTAGILAACHGGDHDAAAPPKPTPMTSYDGTVAHVRRISFCTRIPDDAIAAAVGTKVTTAHYGNGEKLPGSTELSHEYGCVFNGQDGLVARSWVFVPPVTLTTARSLVSKARRMPGCTPTPAAKFGSPAVGTVCTENGVTTVTYRGLFGDAWLACSVGAPAEAATPPDKLVEKAGIWCVQVATTASD